MTRRVASGWLGVLLALALTGCVSCARTGGDPVRDLDAVLAQRTSVLTAAERDVPAIAARLGSEVTSASGRLRESGTLGSRWVRYEVEAVLAPTPGSPPAASELGNALAAVGCDVADEVTQDPAAQHPDVYPAAAQGTCGGEGALVTLRYVAATETAWVGELVEVPSRFEVSVLAGEELRVDEDTLTQYRTGTADDDRDLGWAPPTGATATP